MEFICLYMGFDIYASSQDGYYNAIRVDTPTMTSEFLDELFYMIEKYHQT